MFDTSHFTFWQATQVIEINQINESRYALLYVTLLFKIPSLSVTWGRFVVFSRDSGFLHQ